MTETQPIFRELEKEKISLLQTTARAIETTLRRSFNLKDPFKNIERIAFREPDDFISLFVSSQLANNLLIRLAKANELPWKNLIDPDDMKPVIPSQGGKELHLLKGDFTPFLIDGAANETISASAIKFYRYLALVFLDSAAKIRKLPENPRLRESLIASAVLKVKSKIPSDETFSEYLEEWSQNFKDPIKFPIIAKGAQTFLMAQEADEFLAVTSLGTDIHNEILMRLVKLGENEFIRQLQRLAGKGRTRSWFEIPRAYRPYDSISSEVVQKTADLISKTNSQTAKNLISNFLTSGFAKVVAETYMSAKETNVPVSAEDLEKLIRHFALGSAVAEPIHSFAESTHVAEQTTDDIINYNDAPQFKRRRPKKLRRDDI